MNQVANRKTKVLFAVLFLASSLLGCFHPFGKSTFERIQTKDGKVKITVMVDPGLSTDHVHIVQGYKYWNRVPKKDFIHFTDYFFITESTAGITIHYRGAMIENTFKTSPQIVLDYIASYNDFDTRKSNTDKGTILFSHPPLK